MWGNSPTESPAFDWIQRCLLLQCGVASKAWHATLHTHTRSHTAHAAAPPAQRPPWALGPQARGHTLVASLVTSIYLALCLAKAARAPREGRTAGSWGLRGHTRGGSQFSATLPQRSHTVASRPPASRPSSAAAAAQWRRGLATPPPLPPGRPLEVRAAGTSHSPRCAPAKSSLARRCTRGRWPSAAEPELASRRAALQPHARPALGADWRRRRRRGLGRGARRL